MKHIGFLKPDTFTKILNWLGIPLVFLYIFSMFIFPWFHSGKHWNYVQSVWIQWQGLNVGILAFLASVVAFNISRFNAEKQRQREFTAARAFLPQALSELTSYFKSSSSVYMECWDRLSANPVDRHTPLTAQVPKLPERYREIFSKCIAAAEPDVGEYLAYILMKLQIHHARLEEASRSFGHGVFILVKPNIVSYLYSLGEIQALVNKIFYFARAKDSFSATPLKWEDFQTAYFTLDVPDDQIDDLVGFTERAIARKTSSHDQHRWQFRWF